MLLQLAFLNPSSRSEDYKIDPTLSKLKVILLDYRLTCSKINLMREDWVAEREGPQLSDWFKTGIYMSPLLSHSWQYLETNAVCVNVT